MSEQRDKIQRAINGQHAYAQSNNLPEYAPPDGFCWGCGRNIYNPDSDGHITVNYAMTHLITGCPFCHKTYCD